MNQTSQETSARPFAGRTAIVTGSGQNIGRDIVLAFAAGGANVVVNGSRSREKVERVVAEARELGAQAMGVMADVGDPAAMQDMVDQCIAAFGSADIVVSNVSVRHHRPLLEITRSNGTRRCAPTWAAVFTWHVRPSRTCKSEAGAASCTSQVATGSS
jgi:NAD(P)-dependent dehydrogenase (short-subunit alcohol dehydrogenase family)